MRWFFFSQRQWNHLCTAIGAYICFSFSPFQSYHPLSFNSCITCWNLHYLTTNTIHAEMGCMEMGNFRHAGLVLIFQFLTFPFIKMQLMGWKQEAILKQILRISKLDRSLAGATKHSAFGLKNCGPNQAPHLKMLDVCMGPYYTEMPTWYIVTVDI